MRDKESNLDDLGARYYTSTMGRRMTPDWSARGEAVPYATLTNPQSLNLYAYVLDNPTTGVDPDGHKTGPGDAAESTNGCNENKTTCPDENQRPAVLTSIVDYAFAGKVSATSTTYTATPGKNGTKTITETTTTLTFSSKRGEEQKLLSSTQTVRTTVVDSDGNTLRNSTATRSIRYGEARSTIGTATVDYAIGLAGPNMGSYFFHAMLNDVEAHPFAYAEHAIGFVLPFTDVSETVGGIYAGIEALQTAHDLIKETQ